MKISISLSAITLVSLTAISLACNNDPPPNSNITCILYMVYELCDQPWMQGQPRKMCMERSRKQKNILEKR